MSVNLTFRSSPSSRVSGTITVGSGAGPRDLIRNEYQHVKEMLGHIPSRMELFSRMDDSVYQLCSGNLPRRTQIIYLPFRYIPFL